MRMKIQSWFTVSLSVTVGIFIGESVHAQIDFSGLNQYRGLNNQRPSGGGGNSGPSQAQIAAQQAAAAQQQRLAAAYAVNEKGIAAWKNGDWATAVADFQQALQNNPNDQTIKDNLAAAQQKLNEPQDNNPAADNLQQIVQKFSQSLNNSTAPSSGLDFDGGGGAATGGKSGGLDFMPTDSASILKPTVVTDNPQPKSVLEFGDPMVVDARNVPSGLPKSVDAAIPHTPAGDRMRKGYEAIQDGDWKMALTDFQDALNKEPGDPDLQRLVDLSQFTLVYRSQVQTTSLPNQTSSGDTAWALARANEAAATARAQVAYEQYVAKYGDSHFFERHAAMQKAAQGEGFTKEELKEQLQQALKDYHKNHPDGDLHGPVGGSADNDEIVIGGKG